MAYLILFHWYRKGNALVWLLRRRSWTTPAPRPGTRRQQFPACDQQTAMRLPQCSFPLLLSTGFIGLFDPALFSPALAPFRTTSSELAMLRSYPSHGLLRTCPSNHRLDEPPPSRFSASSQPSFTR